MWTFFYKCLCFLPFAFLGCKSPQVPNEESRKVPEEQVLARFDGGEITVSAFIKRIKIGGGPLLQRAATLKGKLQLLEGMIREALLYKEARRRKIHTREEVRDILNPLLVKKFLQAEFEHRISPEDIPKSEIKKLYHKRIDEFHIPEMVKAAQIVIKDKARAKKILKRALALEGNYQELARIAKHESEDKETRKYAGMLGIFSREQGIKRFGRLITNTLFGMKGAGGQVYPKLLKTKKGFHILILIERYKEVHQSYKEVESGLRAQLYREKRELELDKFVEEFKHKHLLELYFENLKFVPRFPKPKGTL
jgi:hypothetical protein